MLGKRPLGEFAFFYCSQNFVGFWWFLIIKKRKSHRVESALMSKSQYFVHSFIFLENIYPYVFGAYFSNPNAVFMLKFYVLT